MTAVLDMTSPRLVQLLERSLADHRCGRCMGLWRDHDEDQRFACIVEFERLRAESRPCDPAPVPWRAVAGRRLARMLAEATGRFNEEDADKFAAEIVNTFVRAGVVPGSVR